MPTIRLSDDTKRELDGYTDALRERMGAATHSEAVSALLALAAEHPTEDTCEDIGDVVPEVVRLLARTRDEVAGVLLRERRTQLEAIAGAEAREEELRMEIGRLTTVRERLVGRISELEARVSELEPKASNATCIKDELDALRVENQSLQTANEELKTRNSRLAERLTRAREDASNEQGERKRLEEMTEKLAERMRSYTMEGHPIDCAGIPVDGKSPYAPGDGHPVGRDAATRQPDEGKATRKGRTFKETVTEAIAASETLKRRNSSCW